MAIPRSKKTAGVLCLAALCGAGGALIWWNPSLIAPAGPQPVPGAPAGTEPAAYRATVLRTVIHGTGQTASETFVARRGDWSRQEWTENGTRLAAIVRPDRGVTVLVDLTRDVYVEKSIPADPRVPPDGLALTAGQIELLFAGVEPSFAVTRERVGTETVDGHACHVFRSRIESPLGGVSESTIWEAEDLGGLAVRSELTGPDGTRIRTELRDIRLDPEAGLFDPPPTARRVDSFDVP